MDCGALEDVLRGARAGAILLLFFFLSFSCLPMHLCVCLSLRPVFWSMQAHLPDLRQETGPTHDVAYQKENSLRPAGGVKRSDSDLVETGMLSAKKALR